MDWFINFFGICMLICGAIISILLHRTGTLLKQQNENEKNKSRWKKWM